MNITSIRIENFRAFYNKETIGIPSGNNLLVYGENGSGKSSFFRAVHDFFKSSRALVPFEKNSFRLADDGMIQLTFSPPATRAFGVTHSFHSDTKLTDTETGSYIQQAYKAGGFLTYVQLLRTYLIEKKGENPNLFDLLVNNILAEHIIPFDNATPLKKEWDRISESKTMDRRWSEYKALTTAQLSLDPFNDSLAAILTDLQTELNRLLSTYFDHAIKLTIDGFRVSEVSHKKLGNKDIRFNITYGSHSINDGYQFYLNEARLSALAICTYLASLKINPPNVQYKILFLDDVFIGLDTSNRIPLINIINNEFSDYQVFITTYDRNWFDLAKEHINTATWSLMEMYYDRIVLNNPDGTKTVLRDEPAIVNPSPTYIKRAEEYFKAKDYAATANYLRKEIERLVKSKLPIEYRTTQTDNWGTSDITKLDTLIQNLIKYYKDCGEALPQSVKDAFSVLRNSILNPQSHDDNKSPTYRLELDKAFTLITDFASIPLINRKVLLPVGSLLTYSNAAIDYSVSMVLQDNLFLLSVNGVKKLGQSKINLTTWNFQGVEFSNCNAENNLRVAEAVIQKHCTEIYCFHDVYDLIAHSIHLAASPDLLAEFNVEGESLRQKHDAAII
ncbi:MAG: AAA family ATPase [Ignavibacteria bacterium]|nr:AAA family ATPase [Ignavibacteria bacterium]